MSGKMKKNFVRAMLANGDVEEFNEVMTAMKREVEANDFNKKPAKGRKGGDGSIVMTIMSVFNATPSQRDPLQVKLDAKLSHIEIEFGTPGDDNLLSCIDALVGTGAGCIIGNLDHWAGEVLTNPSILVEVFTYKDGKYAPLTMHGIVDPNAEGGNHTTELPVAFRLRTAYKLRCGKELH